MLFEIEQKVSYLSELSIHSESLLLEGRAETKGEAEQLTLKLRSLKDSLLELQQMLQDKQVDIKVRSEIVCVLFFLPSKLLSPSVPRLPSFCLCFFSPCRCVICFVLCCIMLHWLQHQWNYCTNAKGCVMLLHKSPLFGTIEQ